MVELQDQEIIDSAVQAAARCQDVIDELPVSRPAAIEFTQAALEIEMDAPEVSSDRRATPVAVDADNLTLRKLVTKDAFGRPVPGELRDVIAFRTDVVEFEH